MWIFALVGALLAAIDIFIVLCCCVVAHRADEAFGDGEGRILC